VRAAGVERAANCAEPMDMDEEAAKEEVAEEEAAYEEVGGGGRDRSLWAPHIIGPFSRTWRTFDLSLLISEGRPKRIRYWQMNGLRHNKSYCDPY
jgi:hypothetical protein